MVKKIFAIALMVFFGQKVLFAATSLTVTVKDASGNNLAGAQVYAVEFTQEGPGTNSQVLTSNVSGVAAFTLTDGIDYNIFASSQGYTPTLRDQVFNPEHVVIRADGAAQTKTVTLTASSDSVARVRLNITNGTANGIIGCMFREQGEDKEEIAFGLVTLDGTGAGACELPNIPAEATSKTYETGCFDRAKNLGTGNQVTQVIAANDVIALAIDFASANALPPEKHEAQVSVETSASGEQSYNEVGLEGVVQSTYQVSGAYINIPHAGIEFKCRDRYNPSSANFYHCGWANTDENGRFKAYGLQSGTTYYVTVHESCTWGQNSVCFEGFASTAPSKGSPDYAPTHNDFLFSGTKLIKKFQLNRADAGSGRVRIAVKDSLGRALPGAHIGIHPDFNPWHTDVPPFPGPGNDPGNPADDENLNGICDRYPNDMNQNVFHWYPQNDSVDKSNPGLTQRNLTSTTGYALVSDLRPGNYMIEVWTPFSNSQSVYNAGIDGQWSWQWGHRGCFSGSLDDLRVSISTSANADGDNVFVYNSSGTQVSITSVTVTVTVGQNASGVFRGTLNFPQVVDLRSDPITILLRGQCGGNGCSPGNFAVIGDDEEPAQSYSYTINVASGTSYWLQVLANYWGLVREGGGEDQVNLEVSTYVVKNMKFNRAGRVAGNVYKPDGSKFIPGDSGEGWVGGGVNCHGENTWGWTEIQNDGSYAIGGLAPGTIECSAEVWGNTGRVSYAVPDDLPDAQVTAGADASLDIKFVDGELFVFQASTTSLPRLDNKASEHGSLEGEVWKGYRLPAGKSLNNIDIIREVMWEDEKFTFRQGIAQQGEMGGGCEGGFSPRNAWCPKRIPGNKNYDIYLLRTGDAYGWEGGPIGGSPLYFTVVNSTKNFTVDSSHRNLNIYMPWGSTVPAVSVNLLPATQVTAGAALRGKVAANNFFRENDFKQLGGDFEKFDRYIPLIACFDSNQNLLGAGEAEPPISELVPQGMSIMGAVTRGDWETFRTLFATFTGFYYEIRGLPVNTAVNCSLFSPNYPPYAFSTTLGAVASTTTYNIDLDALGVGAIVTGVVTSTSSSTGLTDVTVTIEGKGYPEKKVVASTGSYTFAGLPRGEYRVKASVLGYVTLVKEVSVTATAATAGTSSTVNLALQVAGGGIISGTVYAQRLPFAKTQPGAKIFAFDETYNTANPDKPLTLIKTVTSSTGVYKLEGLTVGNRYKVFLVVPGKYVLNQSTIAPASGVDFTLLTRELEVDAFVRYEPPNYKFLVLVPPDYKSGSFQAWLSESPFNAASSVTVTSSFQQLPGNKFGLTYPAVVINATNKNWVVRVAIKNQAGKSDTQDLVFGPNRQRGVSEPCDLELIGDDTTDDTGRRGNEVLVDSEGKDRTAFAFPAGSAITSSTGTVPKLDITALSTGSLTGSQANASFSGNAYQMDIAGIQFTGKPIEVTLQYDKDTVGANITDLKAMYYSTTTARWTEISGELTADPSAGIATVKFNPTSVGAFGLSRNSLGLLDVNKTAVSMAAMAVNGEFVVNPFNGTSGSGLFAIGTAASGGVAATKYVQYNFPNPFNLKTKTVSLRTGTGGNIGTSIRGTYIVTAPTGSGSVTIKVRIFNLAGDLVREISESGTAAQYNYIHWDGKNDDGSDVASGVYFAIVDAPGAPKKEPIKMVVVK